jgi:hypothetical protein
MQGLLLHLFRHDQFKDRGNLKSLRARDSSAYSLSASQALSRVFFWQVKTS